MFQAKFIEKINTLILRPTTPLPDNRVRLWDNVQNTVGPFNLQMTIQTHCKLDN